MSATTYDTICRGTDLICRYSQDCAYSPRLYTELLIFRCPLRLKRRNQLAGSVTSKETIMKPNQYVQSISKQTSSDSPSEHEGQHCSRVHVQPAGKVTHGKNTSKRIKDPNKKPKPRREKLKELNNIIRDLQRDITSDDDLVLSEVSSILSPEIRYENFEAKSEVKKCNKPEARSTRKRPKASTTINEKGERDKGNNDVDQTLNALSRQYGLTKSDDSINNEISSHKMTKKHIDQSNEHDHQKPTPVPRLYKPSIVSARDIHTEIPSDVPEKSMPVDAKVGTESVLRFPVSIQTDPLLPPVDTFDDQYSRPQTSEPRIPKVETRELSVQTKELNVPTEPESRNIRAKSVMRDVAMNTENIVKEREDEGESVSVY